jgi:3-oxoadipate enol-lactonase
VSSVEAEAGPLHFRRDGTGPAVVLLHPVGLDHASWEGIAGRLGGRFSVIRPDALGHGASPPAPAGATLADHAAAVHRLIRSQGLARPGVVGLSFGGMVAQTLALDHPEDVGALVLAGCSSRTTPERRPTLLERAAAAERGGMAAILEDTLQRWFTPAYLAAGNALPVAERLRSDSVEGWARAWRAMAGLDLTGRLEAIRVPTLCLAGERDAAAAPAVLEAIASRIPGARLSVLPGAPHMMHLEQPDAFASLVGGFLEAVLPR